jgi:hypothetical protein
MWRGWWSNGVGLVGARGKVWVKEEVGFVFLGLVKT